MQVYAQKTINGTVTSAADGTTLPGVSVVVKGTTIATVTDIDGKYVLNNVPDDASALVFAFMGMKTQEVALSGTIVDCALEKEDVTLDEVIVTALGLTRSEKTIGYSATNVDGEDFEKNSSVNVMNSLQGKVAGVAVTSGGGSPGASTKVIIRGYSSVSGNNNPLYVVDGVPIDNSTRTGANDGLDFGNRGNDINPNDIESMTILKGAAATAQYGPRGANGVIMITTKKGKLNQGLNVSINSAFTTSDILRTPQMQNTFGQGWSGHWADDENGSWGPKMDGEVRAWGKVYDNSQQIKPFSPAEYNMYEFYDYGTQLDNSVSVSGGDDVSTFYLSYGNSTIDGVIPTDVDSYDKNTIRVNAKRNGDRINVSASTSYVRTDGSLVPDGWGGSNSAANLYSELLQIPRDFSIVDFKDYQNNPFNSLDYFYTPYAFNPYFSLNENQANFYENRFYGNVTFELKITDWLNFSYRPGVDVSSLGVKQWEAIMTFSPESPYSGDVVTENPGYVREETRLTTEINQDFILAANKTFGDFNVNGLLGYQTYQRDYKRLTSEVNSLVIPYFYDLGNTDSNKDTETYTFQKRMYGMFGQAELGYKDFGTLTLTGRQDYSSTLPADNNSFFYPSASLAIIVNNIVPAIDDFAKLFKVRASWGQAGNDADPYLIDPVMASANVWIPFGDIAFPLGGIGAFEKGNVIGNPELKPEITTEQEVGLALNLFDNRVNFDVALYNRITDGQILQVVIPASSGFSHQVINFGEVQNKGLELLATVVPVRTNSFEWAVTVNYTNNTNEVLDLPGDQTELVIQRAYDVEMVAIEGQPLGIIRAPEYLTDEEGRVIVNGTTGIPLSTTEKTNIGDIQDDFILGLTNTLSFKGLSFGFTIDTRQGGYMYSGTADLHYFVGNATQSTFNERQPFIIPNSVKENPYYDESDANSDMYVENDVPITMQNINAFYYHSTNAASNRDRVIPRSYTKLRNVSLSYDIPTKLLANLKIKGLSVGVSGNNLLLWTPTENNFVDPESTSFGNDLSGAFGEFRTGPTIRSFTGNVRIRF